MNIIIITIKVWQQHGFPWLSSTNYQLLFLASLLDSIQRLHKTDSEQKSLIGQ